MHRVAVVLPLLALLAACGGGAGSAGSSTDAAVAGSGAKAAPAAEAGGGGVQAAADKTTAVEVPRSLIKTAKLEVRVRDVKRATTNAEQIVLSAGGEVADEQLDLRSQDPTASLRLRVPPARLAATLTRLSELGEEQSRSLGTEDVTDKVVDLDSRMATQRTSVTRVRALLDRATSLTDVVRIEAELSRREADLESLQARVRAVSGQVAMSDITLQLTGRAAPAKAASVGFMDGLRGGWDAFTTGARLAAASLGALLPFLPLVVGAVWVALWWRRRVSAA
jgi:hypothetical protein